MDEPAAAPADSTIRLQAVPASSVTEDGGLLRLVRIGGEATPRRIRKTRGFPVAAGRTAGSWSSGWW